MEEHHSLASEGQLMFSTEAISIEFLSLPTHPMAFPKVEYLRQSVWGWGHS